MGLGPLILVSLVRSENKLRVVATAENSHRSDPLTTTFVVADLSQLVNEAMKRLLLGGERVILHDGSLIEDLPTASTGDLESILQNDWLIEKPLVVNSNRLHCQVRSLRHIRCKGAFEVIESYRVFLGRSSVQTGNRKRLEYRWRNELVRRLSLSTIQQKMVSMNRPGRYLAQTEARAFKSKILVYVMEKSNTADVRHVSLGVLKSGKSFRYFVFFHFCCEITNVDSTRISRFPLLKTLLQLGGNHWLTNDILQLKGA